jgi:hypothetical protein
VQPAFQIVVDLLLTLGASTVIAAISFSAFKRLKSRSDLFRSSFTFLLWGVLIFSYAWLAFRHFQSVELLSKSKWLPAAYFGSSVIFMALFEFWLHRRNRRVR